MYVNNSLLKYCYPSERFGFLNLDQISQLLPDSDPRNNKAIQYFADLLYVKIDLIVKNVFFEVLWKKIEVLGFQF